MSAATEGSEVGSAQAAYDVVIVGGGAAGLSAAVALGRARRSLVVIDGGQPRNATAGHVHNYLGMEGTAPADLLAAGRATALGYGAEIVTGNATSAKGSRGAFRVELDDGSAVAALGG